MMLLLLINGIHSVRSPRWDRRLRLEWVELTRVNVSGEGAFFNDTERPLRERVMFGERFDLAILSGPLALTGLTSGKAVLAFRLCDCRCLRVAGDPVCDAMQVLPDCRQRQPGVLFWPARTIGHGAG